jgi:hypothetical protein
MKKLLLASALAISTALAAIPAKADFFNQNAGPWYIFGFEGTPDNNRACVLQYEWQDGSQFQIVKDLVDGEIYIWFKNHEWNIIDKPGDYTGMSVILQGSRGSVKSWNATYQLLNKNTIAIRNMNDAGDFFDLFAGLSVLRFVMPGDIDNAELSLQGSAAGLRSLVSCIQAHEKSGHQQPQQNNNNGSNVWQ